MQQCTAAVTSDGIDVDCGMSVSDVAPGCTETRSTHLVGTWLEMLSADAEDRYTYTGTCPNTYMAHVVTSIDMTAMRTRTSTATGLWQEAAGEWHFVASDPEDPTAFIDCTANFTPNAAVNNVAIDCFSSWTARTDMTECLERSLFSLNGALSDGSLMLQFTGSLERMGACGTLPLTEPGDAPVDFAAVRQ